MLTTNKNPRSNSAKPNGSGAVQQGGVELMPNYGALNMPLKIITETLLFLAFTIIIFNLPSLIQYFGQLTGGN